LSAESRRSSGTTRNATGDGEHPVPPFPPPPTRESWKSRSDEVANVVVRAGRARNDRGARRLRDVRPA
jgi:hypothetical protein